MSPQSELHFLGGEQGILLFSGQHRDSLFIAAIIWNPIVLIASVFLSIEIGIVEWFVLVLIGGSGIQLLIYVFKRKRFRNPVTNEALLALFGEVKTDIDKDLGIELWSRNIDRHIIQSTANVLFKAILMSEGAIADILNLPEKGKVVLAKEVLTIERSYPYREFAIGLFIFIFCAFGETFLFPFGVTYLFLEYILSFSAEVLALLTIALVVGTALVCVLEPIISSRNENYVENVIERVYRSSPVLAGLEVRAGYKVHDSSTEPAHRYESEEKRVPYRRTVMWSLIAALVVFAISLVACFIYLPFAGSFILLPIMVSTIIGFGAFFAVFTGLPLFGSMRVISSLKSLRRSTEWDIPHPLAEAVQKFLNKNDGYEKVTVRAVRGAKSLSVELFGLVVERLNSDQVEETVYAMMPRAVNDLQDIDLIGPVILSELRRTDIKKQYYRWSMRGAIVSVLIFAALFISILPSLASFSHGAYINVLWVLGIFLLLTGTPMVFSMYWKRRADTMSDVKVAKAYPALMEAFQILVDKHYTQPYSITSYESRLERTRARLPK
jgi:hypothetical protein